MLAMNRGGKSSEEDSSASADPNFFAEELLSARVMGAQFMYISRLQRRLNQAQAIVY
jgi:hypothetical protein